MTNEMTVVDSVNNEIVKLEYKLKSNNDWKLVNVVRTGKYESARGK